MPLKIIHTSDWHLGKKLFKVSRIEEQQKFLNWLTDLIIRESVDALIIAGDIFDTPSPPSSALKLYFDFLKEVTDKSHCQVYIIAGNHDSGRFLEAPKEFLSDKKIHIVGQLLPNEEIKTENFLYSVKNKNGEEVEIFLFPYFRSHEVFNLGRLLNLTDPLSEDDKGLYLLTAIEALFKRLLKKKTLPRILVGHHLFGNYEMSGSEQGLSLSGLDTIPLKFLGDYFDYLALGHIHKTQTISHSNPEAYYPGSPIPFRFSESREKSLALLEFTNGQYEKTKISIPVFRKLYTMKATRENLEAQIKDLLKQDCNHELSALLEVKLTMATPEAGLVDWVRQELADSSIELLSFQTIFKGESNQDKKDQTNQGLQSLSTESYFDLFYQKKFPETQEIPPQIKNDFLELIQDSREADGDFQ